MKSNDCTQNEALIPREEGVIIAGGIAAIAGLNSAGTISAVIPADMGRTRSRTGVTLAPDQTTVTTTVAAPTGRAMNGAVPAVRRRIIAVRKVVPPTGRIRMVRRNARVSTKDRRMRKTNLPRSRATPMCSRTIRQ